MHIHCIAKNLHTDVTNTKDVNTINNLIQFPFIWEKSVLIFGMQKLCNLNECLNTAGIFFSHNYRR